MSLSPGSRVGPYEVLSPLGAGGMGEVYRARDPRLGREVAIKFLREDSTTDPERLRRFELEAKAAGALNHPNVLVVFDIGEHEAAPFVVFELLEGDTLRQRLAGNTLQMIGFAVGDVDRALGDARTCNYAAIRPEPEFTKAGDAG